MRDLPWKQSFDGAFCFGNSFGYLGRAGIMRARVRLYEEENLRERGAGGG